MTTARVGSKDPQFSAPYVDVDEWRDEPVRHRYVHGGFEGTDLRFSLYFPPEDRYEGRFFHPLLPMSGTEHAVGSGLLASMAGSIDFAADSGAYLVESNMGRLNPFPGDDWTLAGYRASAAAARYSRVLAAEMYGEHRPYGYVYGGSGGAYKTISCLESTYDVWDGGVPYVHGSPMSLPNVFSAQAHAMRVLWDRFPQIVDAIEPGGSGDMYAGLSVEEREALAEVTRMGFPPRAWFDVERIADGYTGVWTVLADNILRFDPGYVDDFWSVPGYLGADPPESLARARVQHEATIAATVLADEAAALGLPLPLVRNLGDAMAEVPVALRIEGLPDANLRGASLIVQSGKAAGRVLYVVNVVGDLVLTGAGEAHFEGLAGVAAGDHVLIDNSLYLAFQTYHRHQLPEGYPEWDPYVVAGAPVYPQRPLLMGPRFARQGSGSVMSGRFVGKMIVVESLMDEAAYPWQAAWYHRQVAAVLGDRIDDHYRLWFVDHAMHGPPEPLGAPGRPMHPAKTTRVVGYTGVLQQALRDVAAWVEHGIAPPPSTEYEVVDGQVFVPQSASARRGVQPVVEVRANGGARADVRVGEEVRFDAVAEVPAGAGQVVAAEWDFEGTGEYPFVEPGLDGSLARLRLSQTHAFSSPGTYFPALRITSHRRGDVASRHARVQNLGRVRVVVHGS